MRRCPRYRFLRIITTRPLLPPISIRSANNFEQYSATTKNFLVFGLCQTQPLECTSRMKSSLMNRERLARQCKLIYSATSSSQNRDGKNRQRVGSMLAPTWISVNNLQLMRQCYPQKSQSATQSLKKKTGRIPMPC